MDKNLGGRWPLVENEGMKLYMDIMGIPSLIPYLPGQPKKSSTRKSFVVEGRNVLHHAVLSDDAETVPWASSSQCRGLGQLKTSKNT